MLKVMWFGYGGSSWMAERLRETIEELGMLLITIHEHPDANIKWDLTTVYTNLKQADIIILPAPFKRQPCKSNNRLTQAMALGKPIICEPMPSYIPIVKNYENAIILNSSSEGEWLKALKDLRDSPSLREKLAKNALETSKKFTQEEMALSWVVALNNLKFSEKIDVIIPTKNNLEILEMCLDSFKNSTLDESIYIIDNGEGVAELVKKYNLPIEIKEI